MPRGLHVTDARRAQEQLDAERERYELLANMASDIVVEADADWTITWVSESVADYGGWKPAEVVGRRVPDVCHPDDAAAWPEFAAAVARDGQARHALRLAARDGEWWWVKVTARARYGPGGEIVGYVGSGIDIRAEVAAREALADSEARFRIIAEHASDVVMRTDAAATVQWVSPSVASVLGWAPDQIVGRRLHELVHPDDRAQVEERQARLLAGSPVTAPARIRTATGAHRWMSMRVDPMADDTGAPSRRVVALRDVQETLEARRALEVSEERFRSAMQSTPIGMAVLDLDQRFIAVNPALCAMVGREEAWLLAHRLPDVLDPADDADRAETRLRAADGHRVWVQHSVATVHDRDGVATGSVSQFVNVTDAVEARDLLAYQATHDPLTHVANRADLYDHIERLQGHTPRTGDRVGVLFVDVDHLKHVNDTHGHAAGDAVLVEIADRIRRQVRGDDIVARFGGDEFVVVLPSQHGIDDAARVAAGIHAAMAAPVRTAGLSIGVTVSIGVALAEDRVDPDTTLRHADAALYRAKRAGRNTIAVHTPGAEAAEASASR